ncbi:hypothetical protein [Shimia haliotis]|uniref:Uncharacterized protein n=1 Tax=Shimia haliotis TaxID=1280847 RepID=A0A1I4CC02_9RHOB|nr:hypothetical protein [Shimia haliotis]SFK78293.1 hypothetical protein SAMN04488036_102163 [Shimia haliotis]
MTVPTLPLHLVENLERRLVASVTAATSGFTGSQQVQDWGGEWWDFTFEMALTRGREARRLSAFFAALGGMRGQFLFRDPSAGRSDLLADPVVSGGGQSGNTLLTSGWAPSLPVLEIGDFISLGSDADTRLYQITADAVADASGAVTLQITPRLRSSPLSGAALEIVAPAVFLRLTGPVPTRINRADNHRFSVTAREAL